VTQTRHNPEAESIIRAASTDEGVRRKGLGRRGLARILPGSIAVVAALTVPEFSVGAGDLVGGDRFDDPSEPPSTTGLDRVKRGSGAAKGPFAGVRYGALLEVSTAQPPAASLSRIAEFDPAAIALDDALLGPSQLVERPAAVAAVAAPQSFGASARPAQTRRSAAAGADPLDKAAAYAASVLKGFTAPPGVRAEMSPTSGVAATYTAKDSLDIAASYTASVIENFGEMTERRPALSAEMSGISGGEQPLAGPSAPQPALNTALALSSATARADIAVPAVPAGLGEPGAAAASPAMTVQPAANLPVPGTAAPDLARLAPAPTARATAAPSAAVPSVAALSITAPQPVPVANPAAASLPPPVATLAAAVPRPAALLTAPSVSPTKIAITSQLIARVDGKSVGTVDFAQTETGLKVRLGSIAELLGDRYDPAQMAWIKASSASNTYLSLAELQAQGIPISYDPVYDEFNVGLTDTRPKAARKVHMDQITAPERGADSTGIDQVRR